METTLISTIYDVEPIMICATKFSPKKIILLTDAETCDTQKASEDVLGKAVGRFINLETKIINSKDIVDMGCQVSAIIEKERKTSQRIIINVSSNNAPKIFGTLFGAYTKNNFIERIVYIDDETKQPVDLPILKFGLSKTKKTVLNSLIKGNNSVKSLSENIGISRGMTYNHIRELRDMGLIHRERLEITAAGEISINS
ncbi:MAG: CRISPR-associated CARF protein Csa3 [Methanobacteriaceae archaeon]